MLSPNDFLKVQHVRKEVKSGDTILTILRDINLSINRGESVAILGASGSGKTTLLSLLAGLDLPTSGDIFFEKQNIAQLNEEGRATWRGKNIGFIFQSFNLLPNLSALENVMLPLEIKLLPASVCKQKARAALAKVGLTERLQHYPAQLSGGEQQRVAIARAFVTEPNIIFADEMTGNLDTETGKKIVELIFAMNKALKTTLVLVTHDAQLSSHCNRCFNLREGVLTPC